MDTRVGGCGSCCCSDCLYIGAGVHYNGIETHVEDKVSNGTDPKSIGSP